MEEIVNLVGTDSAASEISDKIKNVLYAKASERIDDIRTDISSSLFADESEGEQE